MITYVDAFLKLPQLSEDENQASNTFLNHATLIYFRKTISHSLKKLLADNILLAAASVEDTPEEFVKTVMGATICTSYLCTMIPIY